MKKIFKFYLLALVLLYDFAVFAQPGEGDGGDNGGLEGGDPPAAPINTKIILLVIAALLFAVCSFRKSKSTA